MNFHFIAFPDGEPVPTSTWKRLPKYPPPLTWMRLAGDRAAVGPAQEPHHGGDVLRAGALAGEGVVGEWRAGLGDDAGREVSTAPGTTQLAVIWSAAKIVRQRAAEADERRLGGHHMGAVLGADMRAHAADIDDTLPPFFFSAGRQARDNGRRRRA